MLYAIAIPAQYAAAVAAGQVTLMSTAAGATTTLVAGGTIVGTATLVPAGGAAAGVTAAAGVGGIGLGTAVLAATGIGLLILGVIGVGCVAMAEDQKLKALEAASTQATQMTVTVEGTEDDARAVLAATQAIVDQADLLDHKPLVMSVVSAAA